MILGDQAGCLLRGIFAFGEDEWDRYRVVVKAAVLTAAVFHFLSYRTSSKYSRLGQWVQVVKRRAFALFSKCRECGGNLSRERTTE
jgi:hypothetical protein